MQYDREIANLCSDHTDLDVLESYYDSHDCSVAKTSGDTTFSYENVMTIEHKDQMQKAMLIEMKALEKTARERWSWRCHRSIRLSAANGSSRSSAIEVARR